MPQLRRRVAPGWGQAILLRLEPAYFKKRVYEVTLNNHKDMEIPPQLPLLAVRDVVIFTDMILPLFIGRDISVAAVEAAQENEKLVIISAQTDQSK